MAFLGAFFWGGASKSIIRKGDIYERFSSISNLRHWGVVQLWCFVVGGRRIYYVVRVAEEF